MFSACAFVLVIAGNWKETDFPRGLCVVVLRMGKGSRWLLHLSFQIMKTNKNEPKRIPRSSVDPIAITTTRLDKSGFSEEVNEDV